MENVLLIVLGIIIIFLLLPIIIIKREHNFLHQSYMMTMYYVKERLGFIISLNGVIRIGKTSLQSGLSSISEKIIIQDILELIEKTKMIFHRISFNDIDYVLHNYFELFDLSDKDNYPDFDVITDHLINVFEINGHKYVNNFIGNENIRKYILDYSQAIFVFYYRQNYVQSKTPFYSHTTGKYNLELNIDWLAMKNAYKNKDYAILDWVVILIDELTDEASAGMWQQDIKDISGAKEYRRKFGQIHQERNRLITTKQDIMDEVKKYRNLTHSHLVLEDKVSTTGNFYFIHSFVKFIFSIILFFHKHLFVRIKFWIGKINKKTSGMKFIEYYDRYSDESTIIRRLGNYLYYLKQFLTSIGYNRYYGKVLKRAEDVEKSTAEAEEFYMFIPTIDCWGTYDTHLYKSMQSDLIKESTTITKEVIPNLDPHFFEELDPNKNIDGGDDEFEFE